MSQKGQGILVGHQGEIFVELEDGGGHVGVMEPKKAAFTASALALPEATISTRLACMMS